MKLTFKDSNGNERTGNCFVGALRSLKKVLDDPAVIAPDCTATDAQTLLNEWADAEWIQREAEEMAKLAKSRQDKIAERLKEVMQGDEALSRVSVKGLTVFIKRDIWPKMRLAADATPEAKDAFKRNVILAMKLVGLEGLIAENYNSNTFSAYVRNDLPRDEGTDLPVFPPELALFFEPSEAFKVTCQKARA